MSTGWTSNGCSDRFTVARESTLQLIDAEVAKIREHELRIVDLKWSLNALTPISTLPAELLEKIFLFLVCTHERRSSAIPFCCLDCAQMQFTSTHTSSARSVSQVCHYWRDLSIGSPRMWTITPTTRSKAWIDELHRRSVDVPLFIQFDLLMYPFLSRDSGRDVLIAILEKICHAQELVICNWSPLKDRWLEGCDHLKDTWPVPVHLRRFGFIAESDGISSVHHWPRVLATLCPALEVLALSGLGIHRMDTTLLPSLRELYLDINTKAIATLDAILSILEGLPRLIKLSLKHDPNGHGDPEFPSKTVALPHLRSAALWGHCVLLLANLILPRSAMISLACDADILPGWEYRAYSDIEEHAPLAEGLAAHFSRPSVEGVDDNIIFSSLRLETELTLKLFVTSLPPEQSQLIKPHCQVRVPGFLDATTREVRSQILLTLCQAMPLSGVRELHMCSNPRGFGFPQDCWPEIVQMMPLLEDLRIENENSVRRLCQALAVDTTTDAIPIPGTVPLSLLRRLSFKFTASVQVWTYPEETDAFLMILSTMLTSRLRRGFALKELELDFISRTSHSFWHPIQYGVYTEDGFDGFRSMVETLTLLLPDPYNGRSLYELEHTGIHAQ